MWRIEFSTAEFLPYLPEEAQANPGVYGFELAHWLSRSLAERGVMTSYPVGEDWGWLIEIIEGELEGMIGCSSICNEGEGYKGKPVDWSIFVRSHRSMKQLFTRRSETTTPSQVTDAIEAALKSKGVEVRHIEA